jgi:hypothetical protein
VRIPGFFSCPPFSLTFFFFFSPPTLRSTSAHQSGLTSYLQALYALPSYHNAILSYNTPDRAKLSGDDYKDYWRGDGGNLGMPIALNADEERENRTSRSLSLSLFERD